MSDTFDHEADAYDALIFHDDDDDEYWAYSPKPKTCRLCGKKNLGWVQIGNHWRLNHDCPAEKF